MRRLSNCYQAPELKIDRLTLRPHRWSDFELMHQIWTDPAVGGQITSVIPSRTDSWKRLLQYAGLWPLLGFGYWAVEVQQSGQFIGDVGLAQFHRGVSEEFDALPEAGWILSRSHHNKGFATEAMAAVLSWAEEHCQIKKTVALIRSDNLVSLQLAGKLGYGAFETGSQTQGFFQLVRYSKT
ncbi:MAG: GNAT family N-acetyltransferase [Pseudomonadota bacterium]